MPTVPTYDAFKASPQGARQRFQGGALDARVPTPNLKDQQNKVDMSIKGGNVSPTLLSGISEEFATQGGRQLSAEGEAITSAGRAIADISIDRAQTANRARVNDLLNQAREQAAALTYGDSGYQRIKQRDVLLDPATGKPRDKPMADDYTERFGKGLDDLAGQLTNDDQREQFGLQASSLKSSFYTSALAHENQEFQTYQVSVAEGTVAQATRALALGYTDPVNVQQATLDIKGAWYDTARLVGKSTKWADEQAFNSVSGAHKDVIAAAIGDKKLTFANAYLTAHSKEMTPDDLLTAKNALDDQTSISIGTQAGLEAATTAIQSANPSEVHRAWTLIQSPETGGHHFGGPGSVAGPDDPTTSNKGAIGKNQIMPNTGPVAAKQAGLPWRPDLFYAKRTGDPAKDRAAEAYNDALSEGHFGYLLQTFHGDLTKAWAAYNAGEGGPTHGGGVYAAVKQATAEGHPEAWLSHMPQETQDYVVKLSKLYGSGAGTPPRPTLEQVLAPIYSDRHLMSDPKALQTAVSVATSRFQANKAADEQRKNEAQGEATRLIDSGTRFNDLPIELRTALDPKDIPTLRSFDEKKAKGEPISTDWALYNQLITDPKFLRMADLDTLRPHLDDAEYKTVVEKRATLDKDADAGTAIASLNERVNSKLIEVGIRYDRKTDKDAQQKAGRIRDFVERQVAEFEKRTGKKAGPVDLQGIVNSAFLQVPYGNGWAHPMTPLALLGSTPGATVQVPAADRARITSTLKANKLAVNDKNIEVFYLTEQAKKARTRG